MLSHSVMSSSDTHPQDIMKLRFLMCHHREKSVRGKEMGKKWIYLFKFCENSVREAVREFNERQRDG